jgi:16S rRNA U1498 N3-methylase RsmE
MKIHRFFGKFVIVDNRIVINDVELVHQIKKVLRLAVGEKLMLCMEDGKELLCKIDLLNKNVEVFIISMKKIKMNH